MMKATTRRCSFHSATILSLCFALFGELHRVNGFYSQSIPVSSSFRWLKVQNGVEQSLVILEVSATASSSYAQDDDGEEQRRRRRRLIQQQQIAAETYIDSLSKALHFEDETDIIQETLDLKKQKAKERQSAGCYQVNIPLGNTITSAAAASVVIEQEQKQGLMGIRLAQVVGGRQLADRELDLDTLRFTSSSTTTSIGDVVETTTSTSTAMPSAVSDDAKSGSPTSGDLATMDRSLVFESLDPLFRGLIVSSVVVGSPAWAQGVRPGHIMVSMSATFGDSLWKKSTLDGVWSALSSRRIMAGAAAAAAAATTTADNSKVISLEFREVAERADNRYELTISRPLGFQIGELDDQSGEVYVTKILDDASNLVKHAVRVGDRVLAVDSSFGGRMWPVSSVEGVVSASTTRLPGKPVTFQFERSMVSGESDASLQNSMEAITSRDIDRDRSPSITTTKTSMSSTVFADSGPATGVAGGWDAAVARFPQTADVAAATTKSQQKRTTADDTQTLLKRCRTVLRRYSSTESTRGGATIPSGKTQSIPAIVADRVVDVLTRANASIDTLTLSMIMTSFVTGGNPTAAIRIFESAVGLPGDGSFGPVMRGIGMHSKASDGSNGGHIVASDSALNLVTGTSLISAHAATGNVHAAYRVLLALEGRSGFDVAGLETAPWPFTGVYGTIRPDTQCYNVALSAAEKSSSVDDDRVLGIAWSIFDRMRDPSLSSSSSSSTTTLRKSTRRALSTNNVVSVERQRPEKNVVSYNTMISILTNSGRYDMAFAMFEDMKRLGIRPDKFTYTPLIKACVLEGDIEELLYDMEERNVELDVVTYNTMIKSLCEQKQWTEATKLVTSMEAKGITANSMTYSYLMHAMLKAGKADACLSLFETACSTPRTMSLMENTHIYTTAITAAAVLRDHHRALDLVMKMKARGLKPNLKTLTAVMGACLASRKPDLAAQVYERIDDPDAYAATQGIRAMCAIGDVSGAAREITEGQHRGSSRRLSGKQRSTAYRQVIEASLRHGDYDIARSMMSDQLRMGNLPPKQSLFSIVDILLGAGASLNAKNAGVRDDESDTADARFGFLLFTLDSLLALHQPIDGILYAGILSVGSSLGGNAHKLAATIAQARTTPENVSKNDGDLSSSDKYSMIFDDELVTLPQTIPKEEEEKSWEELFRCYQDSSDEGRRLKLWSRLRSKGLAVRVAARDRRVVMKAETSVKRAKTRIYNTPLPH